MLLLCLKYIYGKKLFKKSKAHINPLTAKVLLFVIILPQCGGIYALLLVCIFLPPTLIKIVFQLSHRKLKCSHSECEQRDRNETIIFLTLPTICARLRLCASMPHTLITSETKERCSK